MDSQQYWPTNDEQVIIQEHLGKTPPAPAHIYVDDDAFADGDDTDHYEFSSTVIRAELARAVSSPQQDEIPTSIEKSPDVDAVATTSVSHSGISGSLYAHLPTTLRQSHAHCRDASDPLPDGSHLYSKFDTVSLSESPVDEKQKPAHVEQNNDSLNETEIASDDGRHSNTEDDNMTELEHHTTHHATTESRRASVEVNPNTLPPSPPRPGFQLDTPTSGGGPETPSRESTSAKTAPTLSSPLSPVSSPNAASSPSRPSSSHKVHKTTRSTGPSALEKVISRTRPSFLPPKSRDEDVKHLSDWENMMKRSRAAGAQ